MMRQLVYQNATSLADLERYQLEKVDSGGCCALVALLVCVTGVLSLYCSYTGRASALGVPTGTL